MGLKIDPNNTGFQLPPEGEYELYPIALAKETARTSGNKMAQINYLIRDDVEGQEKYAGQEIKFDNFVETSAALWRMNQASVAAGMDPDEGYEDIWAWGEDFLNRSVRAVVSHREYNGRTYLQVDAFKQTQVGGIRKPEPPTGDTGSGGVVVDDEDLPF